jgi:hypothetical protein
MGSSEHKAWEIDRETKSRALRSCILVLAFREPTKTLSAAELKGALASEFADLTVAQIAYHLAQLQDAGLVNRPLPGG